MLFISTTRSSDSKIATKYILLHVYVTLVWVNVLLCGITLLAQSNFFNSRFLAVSQCVSVFVCAAFLSW